MSKNVVILAILILALAMRASAQVKAGETSLNLNGSVSGGYSGDYSNFAGSDHSIGGAGEADLSGFYYNPNFLSFDFQPYYNQSRLNSTFQSISASSGLNASAKIFGGSQFPGSVSYSKSYNSSGNFGVPGLANFTTNGNSNALTINWGVLLHDLPSLHFTFSDAGSDYSIYGANMRGQTHSTTFSVTSAYRLAGFSLNGGYVYAGTKNLTPQFLAGEPELQTQTGGNTFFLTAAHTLPWHGNFNASATRYDLTTTLGNTTTPDKYDTTIDTLNGGMSFAPVSHLTLGGNTYYTDNLQGTLFNSLLTAGLVLPQIATSQSSHSLGLTGYANYDIPAHNLHFNFVAERQQQTFMGASFSDDSYDGTALYSKDVWGGTFNGVMGLTWTSVNTTHQSLLGLNTNVNFTRSLRRWNVAGSFGYSQNTQTVLIAYTTSGYTYSSSLTRRVRRRSYWGVTTSGARSLLTGLPDTANSNQNFSTTFGTSKFNINGTYSTSSGNSLLTPTGLVPTPVPVLVINPADVVLYNGSAYSLGFGSSPVRGLTLSASYSKALSGTNSNSTVSNNNNEYLYFLMTHHFRKMNFQAGYSRLVQGFSISGAPPTLVGSYYVGVSRWFNFF